MVDNKISKAEKEAIKAWKAKEKIREKKQKELEQKRKKLMKKLGKLARKKVQAKRITKKSKTTLTLKQREVPNVLGDPNRFFKDEMEEAKNALFLR
jgi:hypothetical protein